MANLRKKIPWKTIFNIAVFSFCGVMILYFCFSEGGFVDLINSTKSINIFWLIAAIAAHLINMALDAWLTHRFLSASVPDIKLRHSIKSALTGQFFSAITPGASGGQPMQIILLSQYKIDPGKSTSASIQKFLVWQFTLTGYSVAVMLLRFGFFSQHLSPVLWIASLIGFIAQGGMIVALLLVSFSPKLTYKLLGWLCKICGKLRIMKNPEKTFKNIEKQLTYFHKSNKELSKRKGFLVGNYIITIIQMTAIYVVPYFVYRALNPANADMPASVVDIVCAQAFVNMVSSLVPLPGASGVAELSFAGFFGSIFDASTMKSAILIWRTITYYGTILVSAPFSGLGKAKTKYNNTDDIIEAGKDIHSENQDNNEM